jgi:hypothetical protein
MDNCWLIPRPPPLYSGSHPIPFVREADRAPGAVWMAREISLPPGFSPSSARPQASNYTDWAILAALVYMVMWISLTQGHFLWRAMKGILELLQVETGTRMIFMWLSCLSFHACRFIQTSLLRPKVARFHSSFLRNLSQLRRLWALHRNSAAPPFLNPSFCQGFQCYKSRHTRIGRVHCTVRNYASENFGRLAMSESCGTQMRWL